MLEEQRIAALGGIEYADAEGAFQHYQNDGDSQHRRAQHHENAGRIVRPDEQRQPEPGHARRAHLVDGDDEVQPGKDGAEARDEDGKAGGNYIGVHIVGGERRGEGPARIHAAGHHGVEGQDATRHVEIPTKQVDLGQRQVLGPDHHRDKEVAQRGRHRRHQKKEDHDDAVHSEHLVIGVGGHQIGLRRQQLQADQARQGPADEEEKRNRNQVKNCNPLVVAGQQPAHQTIFFANEVRLGNPGRSLIGKIDDGVVIVVHGFTVPFLAGACAAGAALPSLSGSRSVVFVVC